MFHCITNKSYVAFMEQNQTDKDVSNIASQSGDTGLSFWYGYSPARNISEYLSYILMSIGWKFQGSIA